MDGHGKELIASVTALSSYKDSRTCKSETIHQTTGNITTGNSITMSLNDNSILTDKGIITLEKSQHMSINQTTYSSTEIDSKLDLINQKVEHSQEKLELIISNAMDKIGDKIAHLETGIDSKIAHLETNIDKKLSDFKANIFAYLIAALLVPFLTVMIPTIIQSINTAVPEKLITAPNNQPK
ncbi:MAG: hypothetical protein ACOYK1_07400 [Vampirovibrionia bacterium]|jgi:hypothetical protein